MTAQHFVVTAADGRRDIFANVHNAKSFKAAMAGSGKKVQLASSADLEAAGVSARLAAPGRAGTASLMVRQMSAMASSATTPRSSAAASTTAAQSADTKPRLSLADMMRKINGMPLSTEGQATMAGRDKGLKVDIVANMRKRVEARAKNGSDAR